MATGVRIEGVEDCLRMFERFPDNMLKIENVAMRSASKAVAKHIRKAIPKRWRRLVKYKVYNVRRGGDTYALIGLYNRKEVAGHQPEGKDPTFDWFKAYWANYGTLTKRDRSHKFKYPIKKNAERRNEKGQPAQKFVETAINGWEDIYISEFENSLKKQEDMLYDR